jgi:hypothetical protein
MPAIGQLRSTNRALLGKLVDLRAAVFEEGAALLEKWRPHLCQSAFSGVATCAGFRSSWYRGGFPRWADARHTCSRVSTQ